MSKTEQTVENQETAQEAAQAQEPKSAGEEKNPQQESENKASPGNKKKKKRKFLTQAEYVKHELRGMDEKKKAVLMGEKSQDKGINLKEKNKLGVRFWTSMPFMRTKITLKTPYIQHVFSRVSAQLAVNCFLCEIYPSVQAWKRWTEVVDAMGEILDMHEKMAEHAIKEMEDHADHLMQMLGLDDSTRMEYAREITYEYAITTPRTARLLELMKRADEAIQKLDVLWMTPGGIDQSALRQQSLVLRAKLMRYTGQLYHQAGRIRMVMRGKITTDGVIDMIQEEIKKYIGVGLKEKDEDGEEMLLNGEREFVENAVKITGVKDDEIVAKPAKAV